MVCRTRKWEARYLYKWRHGLVTTMDDYTPPPFNLTMYKGAVHGVFTRRFVEYLLESKVAQTFLKWLKHTKIPDEFFWSTLNLDPKANAPGGYNGEFQFCLGLS